MAWKQSDQWKWKKVPSVTTGGKPHFYTRRSPRTGQREWAVWDRVTETWAYETETPYPEGKTWGYVPLETKTGFKTAKAAMKYADSGGKTDGYSSQVALGAKGGRKVKLTQSEKSFIRFLESTLIPDLREDGRGGYVQDFEDGLDYIEEYEQGGWPVGSGMYADVTDYLSYLRESIIPDSIENGEDALAADLERMAKMIERRFSPNKR